MMKRFFLYALCFSITLLICSPVRADVEALQATLTAILDDVQGYKEKVVKAQSLKEKIEERAKQAKKYVGDAKAAYQEGKKIYSSATEKASAIKNKVNGIVNAIEEKDMKAIVGYVELKPLKDKFNGKMSDNEAADAVVETMVRKKGEDSIANQKALDYAINKLKAEDMSTLFSKVLVLRQNLRDEEDDLQNPESIDEAVDLFQKAALRSMDRQNRINEMEASMAAFERTVDVQGIDGGREAQNE